MFYADKIHPYCSIDVVSYSDYMPFGMQMPGRNGSTGEYRYGFNGMEKDDEVKNVEGGSYTTEWRQYDPRVSRWLSTDPLAHEFPWQSPYVSMSNNPILRIDPDGDADGIYLDEETGEVLGEDEFGASDGKIHFTSKENWDKFGNSPYAQKSEMLKPGVSQTVNVFDEISKKLEQDLTGYKLPEFSDDVTLGAQLFTSIITVAAEETAGITFKYSKNSPAEKQFFKSMSSYAQRFATAYTIADKGTKIYNAYFVNDKKQQALKETTALAGYLVAGAMMSAPTGVTQVAGLILFVGTGLYDIFINYDNPE